MAPVCRLSLGGSGFFNSVIVGLPFNSISVGSEQWFLYFSCNSVVVV